MSERDPLVAGNWKMNGDAGSLDLLLDVLLSKLSVLALRRCSVLVFPSYVHLGQVARKLRGASVGVGSQDVDQRMQGAVTGGRTREGSRSERHVAVPPWRRGKRGGEGSQ